VRAPGILATIRLAVGAAIGLAGSLEPASGEVLLVREPLPLATPLVVENAGAWVRPDDLRAGTLDLFLTVDSHADAWTIGRGDVCLTDGTSRWGLRTPLVAEGADNAGPIESRKPVRLAFDLPSTLDPARPLRLSIAGGVYAWGGGPGRDTFRLEIWRGPRAVPILTFDGQGRLFHVDASKSTGDVKEYRFACGGAVRTTTRPRWSGRVPAGGAVEGTLTLVTRDGGRHAAPFAGRFTARPAEMPREMLVGVCIYPEEELSADAIAALEAKGQTERDGPFRRERHTPDFYIDRAVEEELGNLLVFWPEVQKTARWSEAQETARIRALADRGLYTMTIYQHQDPATAARLREAGRGRYFLGNSLGEFASYLYQSAASATACGVPQGGDLEACRDWFVSDYIGNGVRGYRPSYERVFSTSGSALGAYELEGGVDVMASELYAIGAANLAYATAEMRGAARRWKPAYWGGWLAHEWQTGAIPYSAEEKFPLLRAGLYQQYLMGTSLIVLESGTQTTQAGVYTAGSGKRNFGFSEAPPNRYRAEMRDFFRFVRERPRAAGLPDVRLALALGHCDAYVGIFLDWLPQWAQFETAKKDANWLYGTPERTWEIAQDLFFPRPAATGKYRNAWLAGSPFGQVDICAIDRLTTPQDLSAYRALAFAGWNSMTDEIAGALRGYLNQGGKVLLALPHLSTRLDRAYRDYGVADLLGRGDLSRLIPVIVKGRKAAAGPVAFPGAGFRAPAAGTLRSLDGEAVADVALGDGVRVVCADAAGAPLAVRFAQGRGEIVLLLAWEYPGKPSLARLYAHLLGEWASEERGDVFITERGEDVPRAGGPNTAFISYAAYADAVYLLNVDTREPHTVRLHRGGRATDVALGPVEFRVMER